MPPRKPKAYKPTYQVGSRVAQVALEFASARRYVSVEEIVAKFEVDAKTARRYLGALRADVFNGIAYPWLLRLEDRTGEEIPVDDSGLEVKIAFNRIARARLGTRLGDDVTDTPAAELLPVYMAFTTLRYLEGVIPKEEVSRLWTDLAERLGPDESLSIRDFGRKFFSVPYTPKDYSQCQDVLAAVADAVVRQHVLEVDYYGLGGEGKHHRFEPWTLAMYKGGLYLLGQSDRREGLIYLAVERIDQVAPALDESGAPVRFRVPADYSPERHFEGIFGIIEGPETEVELEIQTAEAEARLKERMIHPTQEFIHSKGENPILKMRVRGTTELAMWVLSQGPWLKVRRPPELRYEVERLLQDANALYAERR